MTVEIVTIEKEVTDILAKQPDIPAIETAVEANTVGSYLTEVRGFRKRIADFFKPDIDTAHKLHKSLLAKMADVDAKPAQAEQTCRRLLSDWQNRENERIREEQRKLDEAARKKAIEDAKKDGDKKLAAQIQTGKVAVVSQAVAAPVQKVAGVGFRESWHAEVVDKKAFILAVARGAFTDEWLDVNVSAISKVMQASKGKMQIVGIRAVSETVPIHRGA
jgi:hypothetical protein